LLSVRVCDALVVPTFTLPNDSEFGVTLAAAWVPLPDSPTGEPVTGTLAVMVSEPAAWPGDVGRNTTLIVQFMPASRLPPHEPGAPAGWAKGPVNAQVIPVKVEPPV